jgi:hypothetical protein
VYAADDDGGLCGTVGGDGERGRSAAVSADGRGEGGAIEARGFPSSVHVRTAALALFGARQRRFPSFLRS